MCVGRGKGFTLIEILVALTVTSILLVILYGAFKQVVDAIEAINQEREMGITDRLLTITMDKDLTCVFYRRPSRGKKDRYLFWGSNLDAVGEEGGVLLSFFSSHGLFFRPGPVPMEINRISYVIKREGNSYSLFRIQETHADIDHLQAHKSIVEVARYIHKLHLDFINENGTSYSCWNSTRQRYSLPALVDMKMEFKRGDSSYSFHHLFYITNK